MHKYIILLKYYGSLNVIDYYNFRLLGLLCSYITQDVPNFPPDAEKPAQSLAKLFIFHLNNKSAIQRFVTGQVIFQWASVQQVRRLHCHC